MIIVGLPAMLRVSASGVFLFLTFFLRPFSQFKGKKKLHVLEIIEVVKGRLSIISLQRKSKLMIEFINPTKPKNLQIFCYSSNKRFTFGTQRIILSTQQKAH